MSRLEDIHLCREIAEGAPYAAMQCSQMTRCHLAEVLQRPACCILLEEDDALNLHREANLSGSRFGKAAGRRALATQPV